MSTKKKLLTVIKSAPKNQVKNVDFLGQKQALKKLQPPAFPYICPNIFLPHKTDFREA